MDSPKTLLEAITYFSDEQVCIDAVAEMRWPDGAKCPECWTKEPYYIKTQKRWKCRNCRIQFSVKRGSIFEDSAVPLSKWLPALWLLVNSKNGVSSHELSRSLGVTQKTAWFMLQRLRLVLKAMHWGTKVGSNNGGEVEVDESFVGGKLKNMHRQELLRFGLGPRFGLSALAAFCSAKISLRSSLDTRMTFFRAERNLSISGFGTAFSTAYPLIDFVCVLLHKKTLKPNGYAGQSVGR